MNLFIDGYNLIFAASRKMGGFDISNTEAARDKLLAILAKYKSVHSGHITVFFDGGPEAAHLPRRMMTRGLDVLFSDVHSDSDTDIKNAVSHDDNPRGIRVITSDNAIRLFVSGYGAAVTDSAAFLVEVEEALKDHSLPTDEPMEKYEGAAGDDADYWMKMFGTDQE
jgi:predicted RNA-binding protein with PIN domain